LTAKIKSICLAADTNSDACKEDGSVEDNEIEAEQQEEREEDDVVEKLNWGRQEAERMPRVCCLE
jgi:hypothetical protein